MQEGESRVQGHLPAAQQARFPLLPERTPENVSLKEENIHAHGPRGFGPCVLGLVWSFGKTGHHGGEQSVEQSCSPYGTWEEMARSCTYPLITYPGEQTSLC